MGELSSLSRIAFTAAAVAAIHLTVLALRSLSKRVMSSERVARLSKWKTVSSLLTSALVFLAYFTALGLILSEVGVSLRAYLASASIMGLAIGFGSQGLVQDVVNGLTVVFSGLFNVGDMVEISGQTGIVREFGMRFTVMENAFGALVSIPNRTISNVVRYPKGYIRAVVDITLPKDREMAERCKNTAETIMRSTWEQLPGISIFPRSIEGQMSTNSGKEFLRIKFRLWPGRTSPIEISLKQEIVSALRAIDPSYQDWMVSVNYEVEKRTA